MFWPVYIAAPILGILEAIKEVSSNIKLWDNSWFARKGFNPEGYFGPNESTWYKKHMAKNKYLRRFMETLGVGFTDMYHGTDLVYHTIIFSLFTLVAFGLGGSLAIWDGIAGWALLAGTFHLAYHQWIMKKMPDDSKKKT